MSCSLLNNDNSKLEWILLIVSSSLFITACVIFASGATVLLIGFSMSILASVFGIIANRWAHIKLHRVVTVLISITAAILFTVQMILLVIAFPRILPYIYDRRLAPEPFILGAIFSTLVVLFGLVSTTLLAVKHSKSNFRIVNSTPSRFVMLPIDFTPVRYT